MRVLKPRDRNPRSTQRSEYMHRLSCQTSRPLACAVAGTLWSLAIVGHATPVALVAQVSAEQVTINDNRHAAGSLVGNTLTIRLEARLGEWRPDGDDGLAVKVKAFAVENGPLQVPGPLLRVHEGTQIRASIRNRLEEPLAIHGLYARPGKADEATIISPGETRDFTFPAGSPGTYYYWAATDANTPLAQRLGRDTQLSGALVVDPHGAASDADRVLMIANWINDVPVGKPGRANRFVINGRSWPHTERLAYRVGDTVRMRLINAGAAVHPMHLHGFYFNVDSRGNEAENTVYPAGSSPHLVVTERLTPGLTFSLTWKPTRPGNWLFHCHDNVHLDYGGALDGTPAPPRTHRHVQNHTLEMMAGPVMGITVTGESLEVVPAAAANRRQIRVVARVDTGGTAEDPAFGYSLDDGSGRLPPPLLCRDRRCSSSVANPSASRSQTSCPNQPPFTGTASSWRATTTECPTMLATAIGPRAPSSRAARSKHASRRRARARSSTTRTSTTRVSSAPGFRGRCWWWTIRPRSIRRAIW